MLPQSHIFLIRYNTLIITPIVYIPRQLINSLRPN